MPELHQTAAAKTFGATSTTDEVLDSVSLSGKRALVTGVSAGPRRGDGARPRRSRR